MSLIAGMETPQWWQRLAPTMSICASTGRKVPVLPMPAENVRPLQTILDREGYLHLQGVEPSELVTKLAGVVEDICARDLPAVFGFIYDEFWIPFLRLKSVVEAAFGAPYLMIPAFWAWHIDPRKGQAGWPPHRDRNNSLFPDKRPKSLSVWVPLTAATPLNGCMYVVPAHRDLAYGVSGQTSPPQLTDVRALPGNPGDAFIWTQSLLHWGSRSSEMSTTPRISMSVEFQRADLSALEGFAFNPAVMLTFEQRLALTAAQIIKYRHMQAVGAELQAFALDWRARLPGLLGDRPQADHIEGGAPSGSANPQSRGASQEKDSPKALANA